MQVFVQVVVGTYAASNYGGTPVASMYGFSVFALVLTLYLMRRVVPLTYTQNVKEGNFRTSHTVGTARFSLETFNCALEAVVWYCVCVRMRNF